MKSRKIVLSGLFIAFGIILPIIFHQFNMGGPAFLPMHIPVLIAGFFLGATEGLLVGIITPIISSVLTGMPPAFPMLPIMIFELATYGFLAGLFSKKMKLNIYISLILSMLGGRIAAGVVVLVLAQFFGFKGAPIPFVQGSIVAGLPGIVIQFVFVPVLAKLLNKHINSL